MEHLSREQMRAGRAMLDWSMADLALATQVSISTVKRAEESGTAVVSPAALRMIRDALEREGVTFLSDNGDGPGLRLKQRRLFGTVDGATLR